MHGSRPRLVFASLVLVQMVTFLVSLPGFGIETRKASAYAAWAGPIFLTLTALVFVLGIGALVLLRTRLRLARGLGVAQALVAIATNVLDFSHVGGPSPPTGPLVLGVIAILVALLTLGSSTMMRGGRYSPGPSEG